MSSEIIDPRKRYPGIHMTDEEAMNIMQFEQEHGHMLSSEAAMRIALLIERADQDQLEYILQFLQKEITAHEN